MSITKFAFLGGTDMTSYYLYIHKTRTSDKHIYNRSNGKAIPLQAWAGPEASRRLRLPDFKTIGT
jgi:hypothetical protein